MGDNPYLKRIQRAGNGRAGNKSEKLTAKRLNAQLTRYSGAMPNERADMELKQFKIEAKSTTKDSISITRDWLCKVAYEAKQENMTPALVVTFVLATGEARKGESYVLIPEATFKEMVGD
jgi:hypothetical protein